MISTAKASFKRLKSTTLKHKVLDSIFTKDGGFSEEDGGFSEARMNKPILLPI